MDTELKLRVALAFAGEIHYNQTRRGSSLPYLVHPAEVLKKLSDLGITDDTTLVAAILHDTLEDVASSKFDETKRFIWETFGDDVLQVVEELTYLPEAGTKADYIASFKDKRPEAIAIKVVDRVCNCLDKMQERGWSMEYALKGLLLYQILTVGVYRESRQRMAKKFGEGVMTKLTLFAKQVWERA